MRWFERPSNGNLNSHPCRAGETEIVGADMDSADEYPDRYSPKLGDWRFAAAVCVTGIDGNSLEEPIAAHQVTTLATTHRHTSFTTPSATALHLNSGWRAARAAAALKPTIRWNEAVVSPGVVGAHAQDETVGALFDYMELAITAAMSSYAAVEAFCNSVVIEKASAPIKLKRKKDWVEYSPEDVERKVTTDEKLKRIVPDLLGVPTPAGKKEWQQYVVLKDLRDSVTHFKRRDQARHADHLHEPTALQELLNADPCNFPETARSVIRYFSKTSQLPRWMANPSWNRDGG